MNFLLFVQGRIWSNILLNNATTYKTKNKEWIFEKKIVFFWRNTHRKIEELCAGNYAWLKVKSVKIKLENTHIQMFPKKFLLPGCCQSFLWVFWGFDFSLGKHKLFNSRKQNKLYCSAIYSYIIWHKKTSNNSVKVNIIHLYYILP